MLETNHIGHWQFIWLMAGGKFWSLGSLFDASRSPHVSQVTLPLCNAMLKASARAADLETAQEHRHSMAMGSAYTWGCSASGSLPMGRLNSFNVVELFLDSSFSVCLVIVGYLQRTKLAKINPVLHNLAVLWHTLSDTHAEKYLWWRSISKSRGGSSFWTAQCLNLEVFTGTHFDFESVYIYIYKSILPSNKLRVYGIETRLRCQTCGSQSYEYAGAFSQSSGNKLPSLWLGQQQ